MDEKISKLFLPLLDKLYNTEPAGEPFRKPVDVVKYGCIDYYHYVKHPIDLSTIRDRLTGHKYKDAWCFVADIQLMFANAYLFNKRGTPVYDFTNKLNRIWTSELPPIMQRLNYCCGTLHKFGPQLLFCHGTTPDRYCQIPIGAKYKCYHDQYSFCVPCFNKINTDFINIQNLSCETTRMKLPTQPVAKSDFLDCTNDNWQYETFVQCAKCTRRVHQICELYPASDDELGACIQHSELEEEQKKLCTIPHEEIERQRTLIEQLNSSDTDRDEDKKPPGSHLSELPSSRTSSISESFELSGGDVEGDEHINRLPVDLKEIENLTNDAKSVPSLDDELLQLACDIDDLTNSAPNSPIPERQNSTCNNAKDSDILRQQQSSNQIEDRLSSRSRINQAVGTTYQSQGVKNSVDNIAARLSIHKMNVEPSTEIKIRDEVASEARDKFVCNYCYRKRKIGFNLRHRKYSARRLPHTRMSRYIETKVNEYIKDNAPSAGEVTIRILTAYRDTIGVKPEMKEYINRSRKSGSSQHPFLEEYPEEFGFTNRAIFAWQEIDGVDVCVFGMHVQEYGEDCPEPNRQVVYLSYLDSVHFFRPKSVRTAVYHEILLSYFKYVRKLGFRRIFIWVCPSRKGDDYIFYRHPTEQKMPTLRRLADWYVNLLDKGIMAGIVDRHETLHQFATSQNFNSILAMPYLSGDYWPGEFERLLKIMIESQKEYELKFTHSEKKGIFKQSDNTEIIKTSESSMIGTDIREGFLNEGGLIPVSQHKIPPNSGNNQLQRSFNANDVLCLLKSYNGHTTTGGGGGGGGSIFDDINPFTPRSQGSELDQPLDLSKSSSNTSPESFFDEDLSSEMSFQANCGKRKKRKVCSMGYTKKRSKTTQVYKNRVSSSYEPSRKVSSQYSKQSTRQKSTTQPYKESLGAYELLITPEEELMKNLEKSLKRQRDGFIVARLNDCDCSPHFESQRRKEEPTSICELMKGREPFLQLARLKNYEFSSLRRAKFSSLAMVKHLSQTFALDPICNECFSFDSSKCHLVCPQCEDFYLCTSCHENTHHEHPMTSIEPPSLPNIEDFLQQCSNTPIGSISSASSTISNKSFNDSSFDISSVTQSITPTPGSQSNPPNNRQTANSKSTYMPLGCQKQNNHDFELTPRAGDEENANLCSFSPSAKLTLPNRPTPPPSHSNHILDSTDIDQVLVDNFIRQAEVNYDIDFDQMKTESKKLLAHYWGCPVKDTCHQCKFVILSCSFMGVLMRSSRMQMLMDRNAGGILPISTISNNNNSSGINLTKAHQLSSYRSKDV